MLSTLRIHAVRRVLAIILIAMCSFVAVERAQAAINEIQHDLSIAHEDRPAELAMAMMMDGGLYDHDHDAGAGPDDGLAGDEGAPESHHHHAEGPQAAHMASPGVTRLVLGGSAADFPPADSGSPRSATFGLERPPKA
jgi:hypothetical protein